MKMLVTLLLSLTVLSLHAQASTCTGTQGTWVTKDDKERLIIFSTVLVSNSSNDSVEEMIATGALLAKSNLVYCIGNMGAIVIDTNSPLSCFTNKKFKTRPTTLQHVKMQTLCQNEQNAVVRATIRLPKLN